MTHFRSYESIKTEAIKFRRSNDTNDWALGDLAVELEDLGEHLRGEAEKHPAGMSDTDKEMSKGSRVLLERLADDINLPKKSLFIRAKISRRVPSTGHTLSWVRKSTLSYACIREIYAVPSDEDFDRIARKAVSQNMSVRDLRLEMETYRDKKNVESGLYICQTCNDPIVDTSCLISIRAAGGGNKPFCSWACVGDYADKKMTEVGTYTYPSNTDIESIPLEGIELVEASEVEAANPAAYV